MLASFSSSLLDGMERFNRRTLSTTMTESAEIQREVDNIMAGNNSSGIAEDLDEEEQSNNERQGLVPNSDGTRNSETSIS